MKRFVQMALVLCLTLFGVQAGASAYSDKVTLPEGAVIDVRLLPDDGLPEYIVRALKVGNDRMALRSAEAALRSATEESVHAMLAQGHSVRDVAGAVALTPGRIAQLSA